MTTEVDISIINDDGEDHQCHKVYIYLYTIAAWLFFSTMTENYVRRQTIHYDSYSVNDIHVYASIHVYKRLTKIIGIWHEK